MKPAPSTLAAAAAFLALGGCGMARHHADAAISANSPKPQPGMDWTFTPQDANASLAYGGSGGRKLLMACAKGSGTVVVGQPAPADATGVLRMTLTSGTVKSVGEAKVQALPTAPDEKLAAESFSTFDPIMQAFGHNNWIAVPADKDKSDTFAAHPGNKAIAEFLAFCGG